MNQHSDNDPKGTEIIKQGSAILLRSTANGYIYSTEDGERFTNLTNGLCRKLDKSQTEGAFTFPTRLNHAAQQNPLIIELIETLGLALEY